MSAQGIVEAFAAQASRHPHRVAIADVRQSETATFADLLERAERFAGGLRRAGFARGDRLLLAAPLSVDFYALALAAAGSGVTIVLVDGTLDRRRLLSALRSARAHGVVSTLSGLRRWWLVPPLHGTRRYSIDGTAIGVQGLETLRGPRSALEGSHADAPAIVSYTSGSTGRAKGVVRTHRVLLGQHRALDAAFPTVDGDINMPAFPAVVLHDLCLGLPSVLPPIDLRLPADPDVSAVVDAADRLGVTTLSGAPAYMERIVGELLQNGRRLPKVRRITVGGAPVWRSLCAAVIEAFPGADARIVYGATEVEPIAHVSMAELLAAGEDGVLVGAPVPEVEVLLADGLPQRVDGTLRRAELLRFRAPVGEVLVRSEGAAETYLGDSQANASHKLREPGGAVWHRTGDIARRDGRGRLWLLGRRGDAVLWHGRTIYPLPLEAALRELDGVRCAALVVHGGAPELAVTGDDSAVERARAHLLHDGLAGLPVRSMDAIPMDRRHHSKVDRIALADALERTPRGIARTTRQ